MMRSIVIPSLGNTLGVYAFMNLNTGKNINCIIWTTLPMPNHLVYQVHQLANTQPHRVELCNWNNHTIYNGDNDTGAPYENGDDDTHVLS